MTLDTLVNELPWLILALTGPPSLAYVLAKTFEALFSHRDKS